MSVKKRGATWQYDFYHDDKRYRKSGFKTKREATMAENERLNQLTKGFHLDDDISFAEYFRNWTRSRSINKAAGTIQNYNLFSDIINDYFDDAPLNKMTRPKYQAFLNWYGMEAPSRNGGKGHARGTLNQINSIIRSCVNDAIFEGLIYKDFTYKVELNAAVATKKPADKFMDYDDFKKMKQATTENKNWNNFFFFMMIITGARYSDIIDMQYSHINELKNDVYLSGTKTDTAARTVKVSKSDMLVLKDYLSVLPYNMSGYVFRRNGFRPYSSSLNLSLKKLCSELDIKGISMHAIRHTHCSVLIKEGISISYISERLGHKNTQITYETYAHLLKEHKAEAEIKATDAIANL